MLTVYVRLKNGKASWEFSDMIYLARHINLTASNTWITWMWVANGLFPFLNPSMLPWDTWIFQGGMHFISYRNAGKHYMTLRYILRCEFANKDLHSSKRHSVPDRNKHEFKQFSLHLHLGNLPSITTYKTKNMLLYFTIMLCINNTSIIPNVLNLLRVVYFHLIKKKIFPCLSLLPENQWNIHFLNINLLFTHEDWSRTDYKLRACFKLINKINNYQQRPFLRRYGKDFVLLGDVHCRRIFVENSALTEICFRNKKKNKLCGMSWRGLRETKTPLIRGNILLIYKRKNSPHHY